MILVWIVLGYVLLFYINEVYKRVKRAPPGPWPLPIIGNMHQLAMAHSTRPDLALSNLSKTHGEIYRIRVGGNETVILSSYESINYVLARKEALGRDVSGTLVDRNKGINSGLILSEGPKWEKIRAWTMRNLRDYGFNKTLTMEASISDDVQSFFNKIDEMIESSSEKLGVLDVDDCFLVPVFKFTWKLMLGHCTPEDELLLTPLIKKSQKMAEEGIMGAGLVNAFPILRYIFPEWTGHNVMMDFYNESYKVGKELLADAGAQQIKTPASFTEAFVKKIQELGNTPDDIFNEHEFAILFMDLITAGSDTVNSYLQSVTLFMVLYPEIQEKVYQEIRELVPPGQPLVFADAKSLIYTQCVMLEAHRYAKVAQNLVPRKTHEDFSYKDYLIKKGTVVVTDLHTPYNNKEIWKDPETFRPERFMGKDGQVINKEFVIPFGVGKRICPGENLAEVSSFLFFGSIVQKYKLTLVAGKPSPRTDPFVGFTSKPYPFQVSISKRL